MEEIAVGDYYLMKITDGIMHITVRPDVFVELHMVQEVVAFQREVQQGKANLVILDVSKAAGVSKEANEYASGKEVEGLQIAMAILISSLPIRLLANFFIKFNKPPAPTKLFNSTESAIAWLNTFR